MDSPGEKSGSGPDVPAIIGGEARADQRTLRPGETKSAQSLANSDGKNK
jgi:hypothetical protein